eukprot:TRINITY_DN1866_c0_g1_i1.p3 TRINITY_DN1866_c0_g1~~TRINITY_DN1866_c0_g1_i1.p3  ORF type:complete len:117 (+),score=11.95 TRINITY_DN1866_c0_g1_i1:1207-1557(+)
MGQDMEHALKVTREELVAERYNAQAAQILRGTLDRRRFVPPIWEIVNSIRIVWLALVIPLVAGTPINKFAWQVTSKDRAMLPLDVLDPLHEISTGSLATKRSVRRTTVDVSNTQIA